jgi:hypothetical protein
VELFNLNRGPWPNSDMKLSALLQQRQVLLKKVHLANLAFAYHSLAAFAARIARARLAGRVTLRPVAPAEERFWPMLQAHEGSQAVIEEHFSDEDLLDLADIISSSTGDPTREVTFQLEELMETFALPLRAELEKHGVEIDFDGAARDAVH